MNWQIFGKQELIENIGWTLIHSCWQILLVALLLFFSLRIVKNASGNLRYLAGVSALFLAIALPAATFVSFSADSIVKNDTALAENRETTANNTDKAVNKRNEALNDLSDSSETVAFDNKTNLWAFGNLQIRAGKLFTNLLPYFVGLWLLGVLLFAARFGGGVWRTYRLKTRQIFPVSEEWQRKFDNLCEKTGIRRSIKFLQSEIVKTPMVTGWLKPFVIMPASVFLGLNPIELETIVAHELIHIRRHDYLVNIFQSFVEIVLFFHPLVWWISGEVRRERENACDDEVLELFNGQPLLYANALANLEDIRFRANNLTPPQALAANGGNLMLRIERIIKKNTEIRRARESFWSAIPAFLLISAVLIMVFSANLLSGVNAEDNKNTAAGKKIAIGFVSIPSLDRTANPPLDGDATMRLMIGKLTQYKIPAIGFVNGVMIANGEKLRPVHVNMVRLWRDAGLEVGIGNYTHVWFFDTPLDEYMAGVEKNEQIVKKILAEKNLPLRYFSYPYMNTGKSIEDKNKFEAWLKQRGIAPVKYTIDNQEWMYSYAYDMARNDNDVNTMNQIKGEFINYMSKMFDHFEAYSQQMFRRDIAQTMVLTPSRLVADSADELFGMIQKRGYQFVSMDEALKDDAYQTPENFVGKSGISWFERWQMAKGKKLLDEPRVDDDVWKSWNAKKPKE